MSNSVIDFTLSWTFSWTALTFVPTIATVFILGFIFMTSENGEQQLMFFASTVGFLVNFAQDSATFALVDIMPQRTIASKNAAHRNKGDAVSWVCRHDK